MVGMIRGLVVTWLLICPGLLRAEEIPDPDPARYLGAVEAYEQQDLEQPAARAHEILFLGSSTIQNWPLAASFPDLNVVNRGIGGTQMSDLVHFLPRLTKAHCPRIIVLYEGDNDLAAGKSPEQVVADFREAIRWLHCEFPAARLIVIAIKPSPSRWHLFDKVQIANAGIENLICRDSCARFINMQSPMLGAEGKPREDLFVEDRLHLNAAGYALWSERLRPLLTER